MSIDVSYTRRGPPPVDLGEFITVWETIIASETIKLPFTVAIGLNIDVDWGDGSPIENFTTVNPTHVYVSTGQHTVTITGQSTQYGASDITFQSKCIDVIKYGDLGIEDWFRAFYQSSVTDVTATDGVKSEATITAQMFAETTTLTSVDISNFDYTNVTDMSIMFKNCSSLISMDLSNINFGIVADMSQMFRSCTSLTSLDLSNTITNSLINLDQLCLLCANLITVNLSGIDSSNVTAFSSMFEGCTSITSINLTNVDTSSSITMQRMFTNCSALTSLDFSSFDMGNVADISFMFFNCSGFSPDISGFDVSSVTTADRMMESSGFSDSDYDATLLAWSVQTLNSAVLFHAGSAQYTEAAARAILTGAPNNWVITDGGAV